MNKKTTVFITGATGVMGFATLKEFAGRLDRFNVRLLARHSKKNIKKLDPYLSIEGITVVWGDLMNPGDVREALGDAGIVLHIGGMVSPVADHYPAKTMKVNVTAVRNIIQAIKKRPDADKIGLVYIGSVAQTSVRHEPYHWGRTGDPLIAAPYDYYSLSKILAEREVVESGLKKWACLRQSGILHPGILFNGTDPISFHVPLRGVLEWTTVEDSGRLMANICEASTPQEFWNRFYNIGSGARFRLTNYEFMCLLMKALHCPPPEKVFDANWFATRNFHGEWYIDSDELEKLVPFREEIDAESYFARLAAGLPSYFRLAKIVPAMFIKGFMKRVALTKGLGTLDWLRRNDREQHIRAFFGSREEYSRIPEWKEQNLSRPSEKPLRLRHGYDESKPEASLTLHDMSEAANFRGGKVISDFMETGNLDSALEWECARGHRFRATPRTILKGGHWCPACLPAPWRYDEEARINPFLAQVWHASHSLKEDEIYDAASQIGNSVKE